MGGTISFEELQHGYDNNQKFCELLTIMDLEKADLRMVYDLMDTGVNGAVHYSQFVDKVHQLKVQDEHSLLVFIKCSMQHLEHSLSARILEIKEMPRSPQEPVVSKWARDGVGCGARVVGAVSPPTPAMLPGNATREDTLTSNFSAAFRF